jgi:hypothetical protein
MCVLIDIAVIFALAKQYNTTPDEINNLTTKYISPLLLCPYGLCSHFSAGVYFLLVSS